MRTHVLLILIASTLLIGCDECPEDSIISVSDDKYVLGEVAISANANEKFGILKAYINNDHDNDDDMLLRGVLYRYQDFSRELMRFEPIAFKIHEFNGVQIAYDITTDDVPLAEQYYGGISVPTPIPYQFNLHIEAPESMYHRKIHIIIEPEDPSADLQEVTVKSVDPPYEEQRIKVYKVDMQGTPITDQNGNNIEYSLELSGHENGSPVYKFSTDHSHTY